MVSGLTFKSLIHFEFTFVYDVRKWSSFILFHVAVQFSQQHLLKRLSFPHCIVLPPYYRLIAISVGLFLGSPFCFIELCVFYANSILF